MPLSAAQFTEPVGPYAPHLFPLTDAERGAGTTEAEKLETLLGAWIEQAEGLHPTDEAVQALYVAMKADASVYNRMFSAPVSASVDGEGSLSYSAAQLAEWRRRAAESKADYQGATTAPPVASPFAAESVVVSTSTRWGYRPLSGF